MQAVFEGGADLGYVARENNLGGTVVDTVEPLIRNQVGTTMRLENELLSVMQGRLMVCGERILAIEQCLYGHTGVRVSKIYSHPQGLAQCEIFLNRRFPEAERIPASSTVEGVEKILGDENAVAIAPPWVADLYPDVPLLENGIQDDRVNNTRFLVVGREDWPPTGRDKTSLWFTVPDDDRPGAFDSVSQLLALAGINKTVIESRPGKTELGKYVFLVDIDGHCKDKVVELALELIVRAGHTTTLTILGSYPRWQNGA